MTAIKTNIVGELLTLAPQIEERITFDPASGDMILQNGKSRIVLKQDGTIRIEGLRVIGVADVDITLEAAFINLN